MKAICRLTRPPHAEGQYADPHFEGLRWLHQRPPVLTIELRMSTPSDHPACVTDAKAVADTASKGWEEIAVRIAPILGERGFRALYARSVHLVQASFPWLSPPAEPEQTHSFFETLTKSLERQPPRVAADAQRALLLTFTQLLDALIGGALTSRLLSAAPPDDDVEKPGEENSR